MRKRENRKDLWLLAAIAAPAAHFSGCGWLAAGLAALVILPLSRIPKDWSELPKPAALLELLWFGIVAGAFLQGSGDYWPSDARNVVPLTILALALMTNAAATPRIGTVLAFCMALLTIPQAASGAAHLKIQWLRPALSVWPAGLTAALLLPSLPAAKGNGSGSTLLTAGALTVLLAALVQGVISAEVAEALPDAFYQTARTLGHLEPVAAVWITLGWYAMASYLLQSGKQIAVSAGVGTVMASVLPVGTAAAVILSKWQPAQPSLSILSAVMWVLIPFLHKMNKREKSEK